MADIVSRLPGPKRPASPPAAGADPARRVRARVEPVTTSGSAQADRIPGNHLARCRGHRRTVVAPVVGSVVGLQDAVARNATTALDEPHPVVLQDRQLSAVGKLRPRDHRSLIELQKAPT